MLVRTNKTNLTVAHPRELVLGAKLPYHNFIKELTSKYKFKAIYFDDDTFNIGNRHTENMSNLMGKFNTPWFAMCRADTSKKETWKKLRYLQPYERKINN